MKNSQHIGVWFAVILVGFLLSPLMRSGSSMEAFVKSEIAQTRMALGDRVADWAVNFAGGVFELSPLGMVSRTAKGAQSSKEDRELTATVGGPTGKILSSLSDSYLQGLTMQSFVVAMRLAIVLVWAAILAPFLFASAYDGFMQRKVKRAEFGSIRPAPFTLAGMLVIPMIALPFVYLILPFTISPLLAPGWAICVAVPLSILISNMQPLFGR